MDVVFLCPSFPSEMPEFVRGLATVGARVWGVGSEPAGQLPAMSRHHLTGYLQVRNLFDGESTFGAVRDWLGTQHVEPDRVECLAEYFVLTAAFLRERFGCPGLTVEETVPFRDKVAMKRKLDAAGIRTPRHARAGSVAEIRLAAERLGFPLIVKPVAGAGSAHTFRVESAADLDHAIAGTVGVAEVSVEEFIDGEEFTFDTLTLDGKIVYHNIAWYRPRPLVARTHEWISPQVIALRDVDQPLLAGGTAMGNAVISALGFQRGFTHMEWYRKADGEVVFGEIGGRPPGARQVDQMNYACDFDSFVEWARIVCWGRFEAETPRLYNVATVFKRAEGAGRIRAVHGLERLRHDFGRHIVWENLLPVGAPRRDWLQTLISDGFIVLRHPDLAATVHMADRVGSELRLLAS
ncbi:MAG: ATP-grasp domain-containing protein [Myxococcales bacterium]|nr:ATP-grasp domain-containing protein [Myxococcales bacterium]